MRLCDDWCSVDDVIGEAGPCCGDDPPDVEKVVSAIVLASSVLWGLTGERFGGLCEQTVRPCARNEQGAAAWPRLPSAYPPDAQSWVWDPTWNICSCQRGRSCGCNRLSEITLGAYPIDDILWVMVDGAELDPSAYRLDERRWLVRTDGEAWPCCQNLAAPLTEPDTFGVRFTWGEPVPEGGIVAAAIYACQIARSWCGQECELPSRVASITRQGVTATFASQGQLSRGGYTGVEVVDTWIRAVNGGDRPPFPMQIVSPDIPRRLRSASDGAGS